MTFNTTSEKIQTVLNLYNLRRAHKNGTQET